MTTNQNALAAVGILLTGDAIATFFSEHRAALSALVCLVIFCAISYSNFRNRHRP